MSINFVDQANAANHYTTPPPVETANWAKLHPGACYWMTMKMDSTDYWLTMKTKNQRRLVDNPNNPPPNWVLRAQMFSYHILIRRRTQYCCSVLIGRRCSKKLKPYRSTESDFRHDVIFQDGIHTAMTPARSQLASRVRVTSQGSLYMRYSSWSIVNSCLLNKTMTNSANYNTGWAKKVSLLIFCNNFVHCQPIFIIFGTYTL